MDLAIDIFRLAEKVGLVPGLGGACSLAMHIMKTAQISKNNTARLQYLAHSVADDLISIMEHMEGKWDGATDNLSRQIDSFEAVLRDIDKLVTKYSKSLPVVAFVNAGDRDVAIQRLERRLADTHTSILILLGVDASISLKSIESSVDRFSQALESQAFREQSQLQTVVDGVEQVQVSLRSHGVRAEGLYSRVMGIEDALRRGTAQIDQLQQEVGDNGIPLYSRHEWRLLRTVSRHSMSSRNCVIVTLNEAQHRTNGQVVLLRTYEGSDPHARRRLNSQHLACHTDIWVPNVLQLLGESVPTSSIPFQVYDSPDGRVEDVRDWLFRTGRSNPVERICGLYDMRTSMNALIDFQTSQRVSCAWPFHHSVVNVRTSGDRLQWTLIYTGEIERSCDRTQRTPKVHEEYPYLGGGVVDAFCAGSGAWAEGVQVLDAFLKCGIQNVDMATLGSSLVDNGWLGASTKYIHPTTVSLGDVGYRTADRRFVVVANLHSLLTADGGSLTWEVKSVRDPDVSQEVVGVIERSGKSSRRHELRNWSYYSSVLRYANLDQRHAWKVLREHACETIARHALAVSSHDLKLVINVQQTCAFKTDSLAVQEDVGSDEQPQSSEDVFGGQCTSSKTSSDSTYSDQSRIQDHAVLQPDADTKSHADRDMLGQLSSISLTGPAQSRSIERHCSPIYYVFESDGLHVRDSGVPELSPCARATFHAEPEWLDDDRQFALDDEIATPAWRTVEAIGGCELREDRGCWIESLQLPPGVALPFVEELIES